MSIEDKLAQIILARHCKTTWNLEKRLVGISDQPLCEFGLNEAHETAPKLKSLGLDRIVSSPLRRAHHTSEIYSKFLGIPLTINEGLREIDHGDWNGIKLAELLEDETSDFKIWYNDPTKIPIPGGTEPILDAQERIKKTIKEILLAYPAETVLVVMHKHIRSIFTCFLNGLHLSNFRENIDDSVLPIELSKEQLISAYGLE